MPELPEVETMKSILEKHVVGLTFSGVHVLYPRLIQTDKEEFKKNIVNKKIVSLSRRGKYLMFNLSDDSCLIVHFRMEGRFYHVRDLKPNLTSYVTLYFDMDDGSYLIYSDSRKFGVMYLMPKEGIFDRKPLNNVGYEPWDIPNPDYLLEQYKNKSYMIKLGLLDQKAIAGLGNIYADEALFRSRISPFKLARDITYEEAKRLIKNSSDILLESIEKGGSTIRSYHPAKGVSGNMQQELQAYGRENKKCFVCGTKMEKKYVGDRGTTYCPKCQNVRPSIALTGKIASGKSQVLDMFKSLGCKTASADDIVHGLYKDKVFLTKLERRFPQVFSEGKLDKKLIIENMLKDRKFRRSYETVVWSAVKDVLNTFQINNWDSICAVEIPLLFKAKMEKKYTYVVGVETDKQRTYLGYRNDQAIQKHLEVNDASMYEENRSKLDFIIKNNATREELYSQVEKIYKKISR